MESHGKLMTADEIKKSLKQALTVPESYHELIDQGGVFCTTLKILAGDDCYVAHAVGEFFKFVKLRRGKVECLMLKSKEVGAFILYQVGLKVNNYFEMAQTVNSPEDIPRSTLMFSTLTESIESFNLTVNLPPTFKSIAAAETDEVPSNNPKKRGRNADKEKVPRKLVRNSDPVEEWELKEGEKWEWFSGVENAKGRPTWIDGKCRCCHKWWLKKICFTDCHNAASHVPKSEMPADKKKEFGDWRDMRASQN